MTSTGTQLPKVLSLRGAMLVTSFRRLVVRLTLTSVVGSALTRGELANSSVCSFFFYTSMCSELDGGEQVSAVVQRKKDEGGRRPNSRPAWGGIRKQDVGTIRSQKRATN